MKRLLFDLETNGLLPDVDTIHCGVTLDLDTGELLSFGPEPTAYHSWLDLLVEHLRSADVLAGHNICGFDIPVLEKIVGYDPSKQLYLDTTAMSRALYPGSVKTSVLKGKDFALRKKYGDDVLPAKLIGRHSLMAWSHRLRLGVAGKAAYDGGWEKWSPEMQAYCEQDVRANKKILDHFLKKGWPLEVHYTESMLAYWLYHQEQFGVGFDENAAVALMGTLVDRRSVLERELLAEFSPIYKPHGPVVEVKKTMTSKKYKPGEEGYINRLEGGLYQKIVLTEFNPASTQHIAERLKRDYAWEPNDFTPGGLPSVTDDILRDLPWPTATKMANYQQIKHLLGYISEGKEAWLKLVKDGRIHGKVWGTGAVSMRAAHSSPNLANVPKTGKPFGRECRELFRAAGGSVPSNWVLVGCDASSLQLAIYAHYVSRFDGGKLAKLVESGDPHEYMRKATGLHLRDNQKTLTYAKWFGAGFYKQGTIILLDEREAKDQGLRTDPLHSLADAPRLGALADSRLRRKMAGYDEMQTALKEAAKRGWVRGLDGRHIPVSAARLALVSLLQGNEAVVMKRAYVEAGRRLWGEVQGDLAHPSLWIHDEFQWACPPHIADTVGRVLSECITQAGEDFGMTLRLGAEYKVGETWAETH